MRKNDTLKSRLHEIIFEADTPAGKWFDIVLLVFILISVAAVLMESVKAIDARWHRILFYTEWVVTVLFTLEYLLRIAVVRRPVRYMTSFFGIIDLLAILPTYLSLIFVGSQYLATIRILRLLRVFRIFKLTRYVSETTILVNALKASRRKIFVFVATVLLIVVVMGTVMYLIEGHYNSGFDSIPRSMYWAIVTLTTVGYGDISPVSPVGQLIAAFIMILGYGIIAVPTGIITSEIAFQAAHPRTNTQVCRHCGYDHHDDQARYCSQCGYAIHE